MVQQRSSSFTNNLQITEHIGKKMTGNTWGITATVVNATALTSTDSAILFVKYSGGNTNTEQTFQEGRQLLQTHLEVLQQLLV